MKKFLISLMIEGVFDALLKALTRASRRSNSKVDDALVDTLRAERGIIIREILELL